MKKILLPTDFSENSWDAIKYALQLFKEQKCNFMLLNTYTPVIFKWEYLQSSSAELGITDAMKKASVAGLNRIVQRIESEFKNPNHTFSQLSAFNTLPLEIEELSRDGTIDMIVMGTKGASGLEKILFGSNTIHVLKNAQCPVLVIPGDFNFEKPHEILFPSDFEVAFKEDHLLPVLEIAVSHHARVNILHVDYGEVLTEQQKENKKMLEKYLSKSAYLFHTVSNQNITEAISEFQQKYRINFLIMLNNKHSFFENLFFQPVIRQIGFYVNIPFLVIPARV